MNCFILESEKISLLLQNKSKHNSGMIGDREYFECDNECGIFMCGDNILPMKKNKIPKKRKSSKKRNSKKRSSKKKKTSIKRNGSPTKPKGILS